MSTKDKVNNIRPLANNPDYEILIKQRMQDALKNPDNYINKLIRTSNRLNLKLNICIGLCLLKLFLDVIGAF